MRPPSRRWVAGQDQSCKNHLCLRKPWCLGGRRGHLFQGNSRIGTMSLLSHHTCHQPVILKRKKKKSTITDRSKPLCLAICLTSWDSSYIPFPRCPDCSCSVGTTLGFWIQSHRKRSRCPVSSRLLSGREWQVEASSKKKKKQTQKTHNLCSAASMRAHAPEPRDSGSLYWVPTLLPAFHIVGQRTQRRIPASLPISCLTWSHDLFSRNDQALQLPQDLRSGGSSLFLPYLESHSGREP